MTTNQPDRRSPQNAGKPHMPERRVIGKEPTFTLKGRDPFAAELVSTWIHDRLRCTGMTQEIQDAIEIATQMDVFKSHNPNLDLTTDQAIDTVESIQRKAEDLIYHAFLAGVVLTIETQPLHPLSMRNYAMIAETRKKLER